MSTDDPAARALAAMAATGIPFVVVEHGAVTSLAEAAAARSVSAAQVIKTIVVRRGDDDMVLVLVSGNRSIAWPPLRALLGVSRLSLPDRATAEAATGYVPGTITPFGSRTAWPVVADASIPAGPVSIGAGVGGRAFTVDRDDLVRALGATVADVSALDPPG